MRLLECAGTPRGRFLDEFVGFPYRLYASCPHWIPGLKRLEREALTRNPALAHHDLALFLAEERGTILGRIAVFKDRRPEYADRPARLGWLDFVDDPEVSAALLSRAEPWATGVGAREIHGPLGFTDFDKAGILIAGFDECASFHSSYNHAYYEGHLVRHGYRRDAEWVEWLVAPLGRIPASLARAAQAGRERHGMRILEDKSAHTLDALAPAIFGLINESYRSLHGFTRIEPEQMASYRKCWISLVPKDFIAIAMRPDGTPGGFAMALPSLNTAALKSRGTLLPFGIFRFARSLYLERRRVDLLLVAADPPSRRAGALALLTEDFLARFLRLGITEAHAHWQMAGNGRIANLWKRFPAACHKRRACFRKTLGVH